MVPAYDEEARLPAALDRMVEYYGTQSYSWEILVVSDGSTDGTARLVEERGAKEPRVALFAYAPNRGKGCAVRRGMLAARGERVLFCDADGATPQEETEKLMRAMDAGADVAIGSRPLKESALEVRQPYYREQLGRAFNRAVQTLSGLGIDDTQCGFKMFTADASREIFSRTKTDGFGFDFEALMIARDLGLRVAEVPIRWRHQDGSKVSLVRDGSRMLRDLVRLRRAGKARRLAPGPGADG